MLCAACLLIGLGIGAAWESATSNDPIAVTYRAGPATVPAGNRALIVMRQDLLNTLIWNSAAAQQLPVQLQDLQTTIDPNGITLSGHVRGSVLGAGYTASWRATAVVTVAGDGRLAVTLANVEAFGAPLPGIFNEAMARVVDGQLNREVAAMPSFRVHEVDISDHQLLVYLDFVPR